MFNDVDYDDYIDCENDDDDDLRIYKHICIK